MLRHLDPCLMDPLWRGLAAAETYRAKKKIQKVNGPPHSLIDTSFIAASPGAQISGDTRL
jgi:hypothetical protein